ncbi:MAG: glycoside hydrolase [Clostridium butyricum]|nr:glycoside hydrolase [Clostridium butyricum]
MKMKSIKTLVAVLTIMTMTTTSVLPAFAEPNDNQELTSAVSESSNNLNIEKIVENIQSCDSNIEYKMTKLNELKEQIAQKENEIKENEESITAVEHKIEEKDKALSNRMKQIQVSGGLETTTLKYLEAILNSGDVLEAVEKVKLISQICTNDKKLINEAKDAKENLTSIKYKIEKENNELKKSKEVLETEINKLEEDKSKQLDYIKANSNLLDLSTSNIVPITLPSDMSEDAKALITQAQKYLGIPYLWGGTTPAGFDCSGYMQYIFASYGINIPRLSQEQQSYSQPISIAQIKPGDLVFNQKSNATHVGMYIGNDMYIHAPHTGDVIKISQLSTSNMKYAGRVLK